MVRRVWDALGTKMGTAVPEYSHSRQPRQLHPSIRHLPPSSNLAEGKICGARPCGVGSDGGRDGRRDRGIEGRDRDIIGNAKDLADVDFTVIANLGVVLRQDRKVRDAVGLDDLVAGVARLNNVSGSAVLVCGRGCEAEGLPRLKVVAVIHHLVSVERDELIR